MSVAASRSVWPAALAGASASLIGIGLARFAYTPLLPAVVRAGWFSSGDAAYLGAANLAGYLLGVVAARRLARAWAPVAVLRAMCALTALSLAACAWPLGFGWFFGWRLVSGVTGGAIMILAAPTVLAQVARERRGRVSGVIFMGVGLGVAASGVLVPLLLRQGPSAAWLWLGAICLVLTLASWRAWPPAPPAPPSAANRSTRRGRQPWALCAEYALNAVGLVPHMIFLVVFVANGLGQGLERGARYWVAFGLGAMVGPLALGRVADRLGFRTTLRLAFVAEAAAAALPAFQHGALALAASSVLMGAFTPGIVPLVLGRCQEQAGPDPDAQQAAWSAATTAFAAAQAAAAYGMSWLLVRTGSDYALLFELAAAAVVLALAVDLATGRSAEQT